jgi:hypothetical protein
LNGAPYFNFGAVKSGEVCNCNPLHLPPNHKHADGHERYEHCKKLLEARGESIDDPKYAYLSPAYCAAAIILGE